MLSARACRLLCLESVFIAWKPQCSCTFFYSCINSSLAFRFNPSTYANSSQTSIAKMSTSGSARSLSPPKTPSEPVDRAQSRTPTAMARNDPETVQSPTAESIAPEQVELPQSSASTLSSFPEVEEPRDPPRPRHFACRSDGTLTPLIAVDELPPSLTIVGVPRTLSMSGTMGMTSVGAVPRSNGHYTIVMAPSTSSPQHPTVRSPATASRAPTGSIYREEGGLPQENVRQWIQGVDPSNPEVSPPSPTFYLTVS